MKILYFSSTGNSLYVAKSLGGEIIAIPKLINENSYEIKGDAIGIVFPVYGLCVPPYIEEFLKNLNADCSYLFAIATYGTFPGSVCDEISRITLKNGRKFDYINTIKMAQNCITFADMAKQKESNRQQDAIDSILGDIVAKKKFIKKETPFKKYMTKNHKKNYEYPTGAGMTEGFTITDTCKGCGMCARLCPTGNIQLKDGRPLFSESCISCGACIQNCPANAIHHGKEKSSARYRNPHVEVTDLVIS
ncbi:4Fe-4S ferredoxin [Butyrivibrio sp. CB08]|uniref:EFR1 family ferrodoxin n=1 Tax=Butyrivibrio sp. CB08 TaxID=2364879 RepID=UPI000EA9973C|nr:EFR1 family ferrodoxin [Butyrivibrio sp. CB08]RKM62053.1 4Fe-4S ferredoxin [Butyrivibrio sp. CB08]